MVKSLQEVAHEVLARYKGPQLKYDRCYIADYKQPDKPICFEWFIEHLEKAYQEMLDEHYRWLSEGGSDED